MFSIYIELLHLLQIIFIPVFILGLFVDKFRFLFRKKGINSLIYQLKILRRQLKVERCFFSGTV